MKTFFNKLLCLIGLHEWAWKYVRGTTINLDDDPPDHARCKHCNARYKEEPRDPARR